VTYLSLFFAVLPLLACSLRGRQAARAPPAPLPTLRPLDGDEREEDYKAVAGGKRYRGDMKNARKQASWTGGGMNAGIDWNRRAV